MSTLSTTAPQGGAIVSRETFEDDFVILDPHSKNGIAAPKTQERMNCLATISAGFRKADGNPSRTLNGEIYVHDEAPELVKALEANGGKSCTVAFPSNNPNDFIQQRFTAYSKSALLAYGDQNSLTIIGDGGERRELKAGTTEYANAIARCKVSISIYFTLAEWVEGGADIVFPDGFGLYRIRTTSINSLNSILFSINHMRKTTGGVVAGIPFDIFLRKEEHADGDGAKRPCWIWQAVPRRPQGFRFDAAAFRQIAERGTQQVSMLQLTAPAPETIERALEEAKYAIDDDVIDTVAEVTSTPTAPTPAPEPEPAPQPAETVFNVDVRDYQKRYFAIAAGSPYQSDAGRHAFIKDFTGGATSSLSKFLETARLDVAEAMLDKLEALVRGEETQDSATASPRVTAEQLKEYEDLCYRCAGAGLKQPKELLPTDSEATAASRIEKVKTALEEKLAANRAAEDAAIAEAKADGLKPQTPLGSAIREKAFTSKSEEEIAEAEELFGDGAHAPAADIPPYIREALEATASVGFQHEGDLAHPPLIAAINANAKGMFLKQPLTTLDGISEMTASLITSFCITGRLKP